MTTTSDDLEWMTTTSDDPDGDVMHASATSIDHTLTELSLADFEITQLHRLKIESRAVLIFTDPRYFIHSFIDYLAQQVGRLLGHSHKEEPQTKDVIWHTHDQWYETLTLGLLPWYNWLFNYLKVFLGGFLPNPRTALRSLRLAWLSWLLLFILGPFLLVFTLIIELLIFFFPKLLGPLDWLGDQLIVNDGLFEDMDVVINQAKTDLSNLSMRTYSHALAEYLLSVSAAVYSVDVAPYDAAENLYETYAAHDGEALPSKPFLRGKSREREAIQTQIDASQAPLLKSANQLGLETISVSQLDSGYGGPAASLFWNLDAKDENQFLVIAIAGTSIFDPNEWLIDASLQKVQVDPEFLPFVEHQKCYAHQGFYSSLFPARDSQDQTWLRKDLKDLYPTKAILKALIAKAREIKANKPTLDKVPLWLTGHSLGAAIAALLFAHLSTKTEELQGLIELRDGYCFGTPMSTDHNFVKAFHQAMQYGGSSTSTTHGTNASHVPVRQFWRIIDDGDFVTRLPPNLNVVQSDGGVGSLTSIDPDKTTLNGTILDYSSIGYGIKYSSNSTLPSGLPIPNFQIKCGLPAVEVPGGLIDWLSNSKFSLLRIFLQHSPLQYQPNLRRARSAMNRLQAEQQQKQKKQ